MKKLKNLIFTVAIIAIAAISLTSCGKYKGFKKSDSGFYYKIYVSNDTAPQVQLGDAFLMTYSMRVKDSVLVENQTGFDRMIEPIFKGDIYDAISMLHQGDSATFILDGDTFFHYYYNMPFDFEEKELYFDVKISEVIPSAEVKRREQQQQEMLEEMRIAEGTTIQEYLTENKITVTPTETGMYIIPVKKGNGKSAIEGCSVGINYSISFLDGTLIDANPEGEPASFTLVEGRIIPFFMEAILSLKENGKTKCIVPSQMAYGSQGYGNLIPPYTPLLLEVELITVAEKQEIQTSTSIQ